MRKHVLFFFLLGVILLLSGISAGVAEAENSPEKDIFSGMNLTAEGSYSYVQGPGVSDDNYSQSGNSSAEIPLRSGLKAYFYFKAPSIKDFLEKVKVDNDRLDYYRTLFGFNISF